MSDYSTLAHNIKRGIHLFCGSLTNGLRRPEVKFVTQMIYGLIAGKRCHLTEIARKLNEETTLGKVVDRLSRHLMCFDDTDVLFERYITEVSRHFDDKTVLIVDDSDISKPYSKKLEGLCRVRDGSTGETTDGYWFAGVSALTAARRQPIPVYSRVYSSLEEGYVSNNAETLASFAFMSAHFPKTTIRALDRGYDAGYVYDYFIPREEAFIIRLDKRCLLYNGVKTHLAVLAHSSKGDYELPFEAKSGKKAVCKISAVPVSLPKYPGVPLNLVVCGGLGKEPLMLLTNLHRDDNRLCVTITKVYLLRWRIEEYYRFKKQEFCFEKMLVRSLQSIRNLDMFLTIAIGYIGLLSEKTDENIEVRAIIKAAKRLNELARFTFYAIAYGLHDIFAKHYSGIASFLAPKTYSTQFVLPGCG